MLKKETEQSLTTMLQEIRIDLRSNLLQFGFILGGLCRKQHIIGQWSIRLFVN